SSLTLPSRDGLLGEYLFGGSKASSIKNWAGSGAPDMSQINNAGATVYGSNYASIAASVSSNSYGFDTGIPVPNDCTLITVAQKHPAHATPPSMPGSNLAGFINYGGVPHLYNSGSGVLRAKLPAITSEKFVFYAGQMPLGGLGTI